MRGLESKSNHELQIANEVLSNTILLPLNLTLYTTYLISLRRHSGAILDSQRSTNSLLIIIEALSFSVYLRSGYASQAKKSRCKLMATCMKLKNTMCQAHHHASPNLCRNVFRNRRECQHLTSNVLASKHSGRSEPIVINPKCLLLEGHI